MRQNVVWTQATIGDRRAVAEDGVLEFWYVVGRKCGVGQFWYAVRAVRGWGAALTEN
jgi:hypothetical protein